MEHSLMCKFFSLQVFKKDNFTSYKTIPKDGCSESCLSFKTALSSVKQSFINEDKKSNYDTNKKTRHKVTVKGKSSVEEPTKNKYQIKTQIVKEYLFDESARPKLSDINLNDYDSDDTLSADMSLESEDFALGQDGQEENIGEVGSVDVSSICKPTIKLPSFSSTFNTAFIDKKAFREYLKSRKPKPKPRKNPRSRRKGNLQKEEETDQKECTKSKTKIQKQNEEKKLVKTNNKVKTKRRKVEKENKGINAIQTKM